MNEIKFKITTESNCLIGNQTIPFSTGGIDQSTAIDGEGYPIINGSAFKGALRNIYRENIGDFPDTMKYIKEVFNYILEKYKSVISEMETNTEDEEKIRQLKDIIEIIKKKQNDNAPEYIFGIDGLNNTPKLYFSDIKTKERSAPPKEFFLIDMKNTIEEKNGYLESKPRIYKCVRPGIEFEGIIGFNESGIKSEKLKELREPMLKEVKKALLFFNEGFYGIGNSKSRGYGNIRIDMEE